MGLVRGTNIHKNHEKRARRDEEIALSSGKVGRGACGIHLLPPWQHRTDRHTISRTQCLSLNDQSSECHHVYMDGRVVMVEDNVNDMAHTICDDNTTFVMME